jgi:hypothetical protein
MASRGVNTCQGVGNGIRLYCMSVILFVIQFSVTVDAEFPNNFIRRRFVVQQSGS